MLLFLLYSNPWFRLLQLSPFFLFPPCTYTGSVHTVLQDCLQSTEVVVERACACVSVCVCVCVCGAVSEPAYSLTDHNWPLSSWPCRLRQWPAPARTAVPLSLSLLRPPYWWTMGAQWTNDRGGNNGAVFRAEAATVDGKRKMQHSVGEAARERERDIDREAFPEGRKREGGRHIAHRPVKRREREKGGGGGYCVDSVWDRCLSARRA